MKNGDQEIDFIVYQFGKVGSTSLVKTFNQVPGITAYQSHFLGEDFIHHKVNTLLDPDLLPFFIEHGQAQLIKNIELMRMVNAHFHQGLEDRYLVIVTLTREPIDWFRSQTVQQLEAYLQDFLFFSGADNTKEVDEIIIQKAIAEIKNLIKEVLRAGGGFENPQIKFFINKEYLPKLKKKNPEIEKAFKRQIRAFMRPYFWIDNAVKPLIGLSLSDIKFDKEYFYKINYDWGKYFLFRYEDLDVNFNKIVKQLNISDINLMNENISSQKLFSKEVKNAFSDWGSDQDLRKLTHCDYVEKFGY